MEIIDIYDKFLMPGFNDFHVHLVSGGLLEQDGVLRYGADVRRGSSQISLGSPQG